MSEPEVRHEDVVRAVACVRAHAKADALGAFAYDVVSTQAEGRALFSGQKFMAQRAQTHGIDSDAAATELGNLLSILERGPSDRTEHLLVAAFAARGFGAAYAAADSASREQLAHKLASALDWLETATRYRTWACLRELLETAQLQALAAALVQAVLQDDRSVELADPTLPARRARNAARIAMLSAATPDAARAALSDVRARAQDPANRALAGLALGESAVTEKVAPVRISGRSASVTRRPLVAVLRFVSGFALLHAAVRALGFLVRYRRELELELDGSMLRATRRSLLLGRRVRSVDAVYPVTRIRGAARTGRYALLRTIVGMLSLSFGMLIGGYFVFDAARGGAAPLMAAAAALCGLGAGLDLALEVLGPAVRDEVKLQIDLSDARAVALSQVPRADADRFLAALEAQLQARVR